MKIDRISCSAKTVASIEKGTENSTSSSRPSARRSGSHSAGSIDPGSTTSLIATGTIVVIVAGRYGPALARTALNYVINQVGPELSGDVADVVEQSGPFFTSVGSIVSSWAVKSANTVANNAKAWWANQQFNWEEDSGESPLEMLGIEPPDTEDSDAWLDWWLDE